MDLTDRLAEDGDVTESDIISVRARVPDTQQEDDYNDDGEF